MKLLTRFFLALTFSAVAIPLLSSQVVQTAQGKVSGQVEPTSKSIEFRGIPYAAPPVGDLRWRLPQPPAAWHGIRKAADFGASCMQLKPGERLPWTKEFMVQNPISEDCLYLNIWTPEASTTAKLPVIVFIHGGGFREGSGAIDVYRGGNLAAKGVVVVTLNYRLGIFGFLAHPALTAESAHRSSGNYGLLDQIEALHWIQSNIARFGGQPDNITIWGQSAGAFSVAALVASPLTAGLFQHAQADSGLGSGGLPMRTLKDAEELGVKFADQNHASSIKDLRAIHADALLSASQNVDSPFAFAPIVDGWLLPDTPNHMNAKATDQDVPIVTGYQAGDSQLFAPRINSLEEYEQMARKSYGEMAPEFEKLYPVKNVDDIHKAIAQSGQDRSRVSMFLWASERAKSHRQPVFTYYFDRAIPWPQHPEFGPFHTGEIPYFFLNLKALDRPWKTEDYRIAKSASSYLINFASKGDPRGDGLEPWIKLDPTEPRTMELGTRVGSMAVADKEKLDFWTRYYHSPISNTAGPF